MYKCFLFLVSLSFIFQSRSLLVILSGGGGDFFEILLKKIYFLLFTYDKSFFFTLHKIEFVVNDLGM